LPVTAASPPSFFEDQCSSAAVTESTACCAAEKKDVTPPASADGLTPLDGACFALEAVDDDCATDHGADGRFFSADGEFADGLFADGLFADGVFSATLDSASSEMTPTDALSSTDAFLSLLPSLTNASVKLGSVSVIR
jgi:hypothetical protein